MLRFSAKQNVFYSFQLLFVSVTIHFNLELNIWGLDVTFIQNISMGEKREGGNLGENLGNIGEFFFSSIRTTHSAEIHKVFSFGKHISQSCFLPHVAP